MVILADDLDLVAITPQAQDLLSALDDWGRGLPLPVAVYAVADALGAVDRGPAGQHMPPGIRVRGTAGR